MIGRSVSCCSTGACLGRTDDMMIIRGVNVFPSAIEQILRSFPEVPEYRLTAHKVAEMDQLLVEIEDHLDNPDRVAEELQLRLGLKVEVRAVPLGTLPRFEGKGGALCRPAMTTTTDLPHGPARMKCARPLRRQTHWPHGRHGARLSCRRTWSSCRSARCATILPSSAG